MLLLVTWFGCPRADTIAFSWADTPRLPSPASGTYARAPNRPDDPGVASVVGSRPWDAALSGAAAGLGLALATGQGGFSAPEVREAAWRAGWPYPVNNARTWPVRVGEAPPSTLADWIAAVPEGTDFGLVRVRGTLEETWIGLTSLVRADVGTLPRQLPLGGQLALRPSAGARVTMVDPHGGVVSSHLEVDFTHTVEIAGEWLVEVRTVDHVVASFPIYVGMLPPNLGLLVPSEPPTNETDALTLTDLVLGDLRDAYGLGPFSPDVLLDAAARAPGAIALEALAPRVGVPLDRLWRWECRAATVEGCLDSVLWDPRARPGLLAEQALIGRTAVVGPMGVHLLMLVASEP